MREAYRGSTRDLLMKEGIPSIRFLSRTTAIMVWVLMFTSSFDRYLMAKA